jgi:hypothetical protein
MGCAGGPAGCEDGVPWVPEERRLPTIAGTSSKRTHDEWPLCHARGHVNNAVRIAEATLLPPPPPLVLPPSGASAVAPALAVAMLVVASSASPSSALHVSALPSSALSLSALPLSALPLSALLLACPRPPPLHLMPKHAKHVSSQPSPVPSSRRLTQRAVEGARGDERRWERR